MSGRQKILLAMIASMVFGYMPWYNFSAVLKYISAEFNLTAADTGFILAAFQAGYVLVVPATGWLGDKIGLKKIVFWATLVTGVFSTIFIWGAHDKWSILVLRLITGLSAGAIYVPGLALLSKWFSPSERGAALGAYTGALVAAYAGGYFIASPLAAAYGWRVGILWTSLPAFAAALIIYLFVREAPAEAKEEGALAQPGLAGIAPEQLKGHPAPIGGNKGPVLISVGYMGHMWELYAFWGWIGPFLVAAASAAGMPANAAVKWGGTMAASIILLGAPSSWLWGIFADRRGRIWAIMVASCLSLVAELFLGYLYGYSLAVVVLVGAWIGFWVIADSAVYKAGLTEMVLPRVRGTYLGIQSAVGYFMTILAPMVFGIVLEHYNGSVDPTSASLWGPAFLLLGLGALLVPVASLFLRLQPQARLMGHGRK